MQIKPPTKAFHIASLYILWGSLWVILSNRWSTQPGAGRPLSDVGDMGIETLKGILLVSVTGVLLFLLIKWLLVRQNQAYEALRESKEEYQLLFRANPHPMWVFESGTLRFLAVNEAAMAYYGYSEEEFLAMTIEQIRPPEDLPRLRRVVESIEGANNSSLWRHRKKNGEIIDVEIRSRPLNFGGRHGRLVLAVDLTDYFRSKQEIRHLNTQLERRVAERTAQLEQANRELEAFSYSVSHDLRAPLRSIDGFSRLVAEEYAEQLPQPARDYLGLVRANAQQMGVLIDEVLAFSKLNRLPLNTTHIKMALLARQALELLHFEQTERTVTVELGELPECEGDLVLLRQVFVNLISNALKFTRHREAACIEVGFLPLEAEAGGGAYYVSDNGVGFDMAYSGQLFGVFQRLHSAQEYEGTGIGLANVQRIVQRHGGRVWAEAAIDKGARFYFTVGSANPLPPPGAAAPLGV